tara:strand:+ start:1041 stop:1349 length:309 start_codon:yes stop_codon:yes gene_type:complete
MIPKIDKRVMQSIMSRLLIHNNKSGQFGYEDIECTIDDDNEELAEVAYVIMDSCIDYLIESLLEDGTEEQIKDAIYSITKIGIHFTYKSINSQIEINEMNNV